MRCALADFDGRKSILPLTQWWSHWICGEANLHELNITHCGIEPMTNSLIWFLVHVNGRNMLALRIALNQTKRICMVMGEMGHIGWFGLAIFLAIRLHKIWCVCIFAGIVTHHMALQVHLKWHLFIHWKLDISVELTSISFAPNLPSQTSSWAMPVKNSMIFASQHPSIIHFNLIASDDETSNKAIAFHLNIQNWVFFFSLPLFNEMNHKHWAISVFNCMRCNWKRKKAHKIPEWLENVLKGISVYVLAHIHLKRHLFES